jgi:cytochrome d ubiquinol oxidase subunit II
VLQARARDLTARLWLVLGALTVAVTLATFAARRQMFQNFRAAPALLIAPLLAALFLVLMRRSLRGRDDGLAFLCSCGVICALLASTAMGLYPYLLLSEPHPERSLTIANAAAAPGGLLAGALWMTPGVILLAVYQGFVYRTFKGKVVPGTGAHY